MSKIENTEENINTEEKAEETVIPEEGTVENTEDTSSEGNEAAAPEEAAEKPKKKERKMKWARASQEEAEKTISDLEEKAAAANDKYARLFAEFDNFRKRSEKEKSQRYDLGASEMVKKILPIIDNFERGLAGVPEDKAEDPFVSGMQMTYKLLLKTLEDAGVKPIEAVGKEFNPDYHYAAMHVDDPEVGDNIIVEEFQKGYIYKDQVVRYSMVKVAN